MGEVQAVWIYVQTVLASLAVVLCGSWRPAPAPVPALFVQDHGASESLELDVAEDAVPSPLPSPTAQGEPPADVHAAEAPQTVRLSDELRRLVPGAGQTLEIDPETLWLARCMYSESDLPHEQELVGWVVRNRVATGYRGKHTYRDVVLDPQQFSAFNADSGRRGRYVSLRPGDRAPGWRRTLAIAAYVRRAPWSYRPFSVAVRHFYSEISMGPKRHPVWAIGERPVVPNRLYAVDPYRFRFLALRSGI